jgi:hypothetical protein
MIKIYSVKKNSSTKEEIKKMIEGSFNYLPTFEKNIGIVDFCLDLALIADKETNTNFFLVIDGFSNTISYKNNDLEEITLDQLRSTIRTGYTLSLTGQDRLFHSIGYELSRYSSYSQTWVKISIVPLI